MASPLVVLLFALPVPLLLSGCNEFPTVPDPLEGFSETEQMLLGTWSYRSVIVKEEEFVWATSEMEPGNVKATLGGERAELFRRKVNYSTEKTYQLQWIDRGNYELGTSGEPNWQPKFGSWYLNAAQDSLIHNGGTTSETAYAINFSLGTFSRTSVRYMSTDLYFNGSYLWREGEWVEFTEVFQRDIE